MSTKYVAPKAVRMSDMGCAAGECDPSGSGDAGGCFFPGSSAGGDGCAIPGNSATNDCFDPGSGF
jgi:hypothetical protein